MTKKNNFPMLLAVVLVSVALANAGCVSAIQYGIDHMTSQPTPTMTPTTEPVQLPTATAAPTATPAPTATVPPHIDLIYTAPLESGIDSNSSGIHILRGNVSYNGNPASGFTVLVDTVGGFEYGNKTDSKGFFVVTFHDDWNANYTMKVIDDKGLFLYSDKTPRLLNDTGPFGIAFEVPPSKQIHVTITPY